jgi:predicted nucleic acid-binding protein
MPAKIFVDTNVLVYTRDASEPSKQKQALDWMTHLWSTKTGRLSFQVLNEFYVTVTEKLDPGLDTRSARKDVLSFLTWEPIPVDARVIEGAWGLQDNYHLSWWDALIVSAAQASGCHYLLTEDLREKQKLGDVTIINPFHLSPETLEK